MFVKLSGLFLVLKAVSAVSEEFVHFKWSDYHAFGEQTYGVNALKESEEESDFPQASPPNESLDFYWKKIPGSKEGVHSEMFAYDPLPLDLFPNEAWNRSMGAQYHYEDSQLSKRQGGPICQHLSVCENSPAVSNFQELFDRLDPYTCDNIKESSKNWILQKWSYLARATVINIAFAIVGGVITFYITQNASKDSKPSYTCNVSKDDACGICEAQEFYHRIDGKIEEIC